MGISADLPSPGEKDGGGRTYTPFHRDLDAKFPIEKLLNREQRASIFQGKVKPLNWVSVFRNSPFINSEAEIIMGKFVSMAVLVGQWIDIPVVEDESFGAKFDLPNGTSVDFGEHKLEFGRATELMEQKHYLERVSDEDGKTWLAPTAKMVSFVAERFK